LVLFYLIITNKHPKVEQLLSTKFFIPPTRPEIVPRPHLVERLDQGLHQKLTLISAPAGFGKTTLVTEWLGSLKLAAENDTQTAYRVAWLSMDEGDNDPNRFLAYLIAALNQIEGLEAVFGPGTLGMFQSPQPPPSEAILTSLINDIASNPFRINFVLDDYHLIESPAVHEALRFLLDNLPPQLHLVLATREDPPLPLARLRAQGQLTELRAADLRFNLVEADEFLNQVMGLALSTEDVAALETRTEGWIAGLQLAAISLQGQEDTTHLIESFTGSHRFVLDYLFEEILEQLPEDVKIFMLQTAILNRLTGSLCDALTGQENGRATLEMLERANLFIVPLDEERQWYRYHHLFADLLQLRLHQASPPSGGVEVAELHIRASQWFEDHSLEIEAFQHAAAANDIERAARLIEGEGVPLQYRGAVAPVLNWLALLPATVLDSRPSLWVTYASALNLTGQPADAEQKLQAAEAAIAKAATAGPAQQGTREDVKANDILGHMAAIRAMMAVSTNQIETIITQSRLALELLNSNNLPVRTITTWTLGRAYHLQGAKAAAKQAYTDGLSISQSSGDIISTLAAATGLGSIHESENQLFLAAESYRRGLQVFGNQPQPFACETVLGLARIHYEWNDLEAAQQLGKQSLQLARQVESVDTFAICQVLLAKLNLAQDDIFGAVALLAEADQFLHQRNFTDRMHEVAAAQVRTLLRQGALAEAAQMAESYKLPLSKARVLLAQDDSAAALEVLEPWRQQVEAEDWPAERLKVLGLLAIARHAHNDKEEAMQLLGEALALAEPGGFVRIFVDEGPPMARLLYKALSKEIAPKYIQRLLGAFLITEPKQAYPAKEQAPQSDWVEPLSEREIEVLHLIAAGLTNQEIASRLYLSLHTVKGHTRNIFGKLGVKNRVQAVARGKSLGILPSF
jgi:LuxR family maltose regulon positive regulatory protein